jgi:hypothetical protein
MIRSQFEGARDLLKDVWYTSSRYPGRLKAEIVAKQVAGYRTLSELTPEQVEKAFWLGYTLAQAHWREIDECREKRKQGNSCPNLLREKP